MRDCHSCHLIISLFRFPLDMRLYRGANANTWLFGFPGAICAYPEPQYTTPSAIDGPSITEPPLSKLQRIFPVLADSAYINPEYDPAYITPFATLTAPISTAPLVGSAVCQTIRPVRTLRALHEPHVMVSPRFMSLCAS